MFAPDEPIFCIGGMAMEDKIKWETEMAAALDKARTENKNILLDFFNPG